MLVHLISPDDVAAVLVEPIQGEGGYVVPAKAFHERLRALTTKHGMLLMVDEVQSGMGRTGKMLAIEHFGVQPDVVTVAKGIASGLPLGVTVAQGRRDGVAAGRARQHVRRQSGVVRRGHRHHRAAAHLAREERGRGRRPPAAGPAGAAWTSTPIIGDVRGKGLMIGVELVRDRATKERATTERNAVVNEAFTRGMLILGAGQNAVRFSPPLVLSKAQADTAIRIFDESLTAVTAQREVARRAGGLALARRPCMTHARQALGLEGETRACLAARSARLPRPGAALSHAARRDSTSSPATTASIVFVEVKTRRGCAFGDPAAAVTWQKQRRLVAMADDYLARHRLESAAVRFDVVCVEFGPNSPPVITVYPDAFRPGW